MPHIPHAVCGKCLVEMKVEKNGVVIETTVGSEYSRSPYYKIAADLYRCPSCNWTAYGGFSRTVLDRHDPKFKKFKTDIFVDL